MRSRTGDTQGWIVPVGVAFGATVGIALLVGCGSEGQGQVTDMTAVIVKTAAASQGQVALAGEGVEVSGPLSCSAEPAGEQQFTLSCSGTALDGRAVTVTGTATSVPGGSSVAGTFVGTAGGQQVFSTDCLGSC